MTPGGFLTDGRQRWGTAFAIAATLHGAAAVGLILLARPLVKHDDPPVVTVELPPLPPSSAAVGAVKPATPAAKMAPPASSPIDVPTARAAVPPDSVMVPPKTTNPYPAPAPVPQSVPAQTQAPPAPAPAPASLAAAAPSANASIGDDPKAKKAEVNYYQLLMAYLARRKEYPAEARQAREQGVVMVRFTIGSQGDVSAVSIKRSSGFNTLDAATLALMRRVSPVPPIPSFMHRDTITIALPIEYSLSSK